MFVCFRFPDKLFAVKTNKCNHISCFSRSGFGTFLPRSVGLYILMGMAVCEMKGTVVG